MKYHKDDYILESIINESILCYSTYFHDLLEYLSYRNKIAKALLDLEGENIKHDITYVNYNPDSYDKFLSFSTSGTVSKLIKLITKKENVLDDEISKFSIHDVLYKNGRIYIRIGKFINRIFGDRFNDTEIEEFVNLIKSTRIIGNIEIVSGNDIKEYYKSDRILQTKGSLASSCMNDFMDLDLYTKNPNVCKLLILKVGNKISLRALLWKINKTNIIGNPEYFLDRIYYNNDSDLKYVEEYANEMGWVHRGGIRDLKFYYKGNVYSDKEYFINVFIKKGNYKKYPYLDSLCYYNPYNGILSTSNVEYSFLLRSAYGNYQDNRNLFRRIFNPVSVSESRIMNFSGFLESLTFNTDYIYSGDILESLNIWHDSLLESIDAQEVNIFDVFSLPLDDYKNRLDIDFLSNNIEFINSLLSIGLKKSEVQVSSNYETFLNKPCKFMFIYDVNSNELENPEYLMFQVWNDTLNNWDNTTLYKVNGDVKRFYDKLTSRTIEIIDGDEKFIYETSNGNEWSLQNIENENDTYIRSFRKNDLQNLLNTRKGIKVTVI